MRVEIEALKKNETWELKPKIKLYSNYLQMSLSTKNKLDVTIDKSEAPLFARGFSQNYGLDYEET